MFDCLLLAMKRDGVATGGLDTGLERREQAEIFSEDIERSQKREPPADAADGAGVFADVELVVETARV